MSDRLEDLKRFIYDTLLEWTDFDPDGQISFLIDSRFSETKQALQSYTTNKIKETVQLNRIELAKDIKHRHWANDKLRDAYLDAVISVAKEQLALNHRKENE